MKKIIIVILALFVLFVGLNRHSIKSYLSSHFSSTHKNSKTTEKAVALVINYPPIPEAKQISDIPVRLDGNDRFKVSANIASKWGQADTIVLTNYLAFADALSATPFAYKLNAPILLTDPNFLPEDTKKQIQSLHVKNVVLVGGEASISSKVVSDLNSLGITNIDRIAGKDRFEVSKNIALKLGLKGTAVFANGLSFPDALSIAPYAATNSFPILLTEKNQIPSDISALLKKAVIMKSVVIGGEGSVSQSIFQQLPNPTRIGGKDRYDVAANVANTFGQNRQRNFLASGSVFADALTGSVLAAKERGIMLLTKNDRLSPSTLEVIKHKFVPMTIFGGVGSIHDNIVLTITQQVPTKRPVLYIIPHQDDEILSYGVDIRNELSRGRQVQLILLTRGDDSKSRDIINGKVYCNIHKRFHNPLKEKYKDGSLTPSEFANARTNEYYHASTALGVPIGNIHTDFIPDGKYYSTAIKAVIEKYLATYPNADVRSFSWFDQHPAHALIGKTILAMQSLGEIERYQAKFLVSINTDRFYEVQKPMKVMKNRIENPNDVQFLRNAIREYRRFDPQKGDYAIGYHSVQVQFDALWKDPYVNSHY